MTKDYISRGATTYRILQRYHVGITTQIGVRLPRELVEFIDGLVASGEAASRGAVVARALEHERRRLVAQRDAAILAGPGATPDLEDLARHARRTPLVLE